MLIGSLVVVVIVVVCVASVSGGTVPKTYTCMDDGRCRLNDALLSSALSGQQSLSQDTCLMGCGMGHLWPYPSGEVHFPVPSTLPSVIAYLPTFDVDIKFSSTPSKKMTTLLSAMEHNFRTEVSREDKRRFIHAPATRGVVRISVQLKDYDTVRANYLNDESYSLEIKDKANAVSNSKQSDDIHVAISANTVFGYRHALETLSQLISFDSARNSFAIVTQVEILNDGPTFPYRGIMIDVSRNFISVDKVKENIRAAGYNKMNVVHMHLSDTPSIPLTFPRQPNMTYYGAYSDKNVFSTEDISNLVEFANGYGIMLIPEIDAPAHMGAGWQWGSKAAGFSDDLVICHDANANGGSQEWLQHALGPPGGQLNLGNPAVYDVLQDIYHDVLDQFQYPSIFHLGGDEVIIGSERSSHHCYNDSILATSIITYLESQGYSRQDQQSFYALWGNFTLRATQLVEDLYKENALSMKECSSCASRKLHIWGGGGVDETGGSYNMFSLSNVQDYLPPNIFTVQVWDTSVGSIVPSLVQQGYKVILSHTDYVYLDCGNAGYVNAGGYWCQPYHEWYHLYNYIYDVHQLYVKGSNNGSEPVQLTDEQFFKNILGSETLIWTEMTDDISVSQKLWPRSAALAEALWTNPHSNARYIRSLQRSSLLRSESGAIPTDDSLWYEAADRMLHWRYRLAQRGVAAEALQPTWCRQRESGYCSLNKGTPQ
jgi:hexosaminidase